MTQYSEDFSGVTVTSNVPSGFTAHSDHSSVTWSVGTESGTYGGKYLRAVSTNTTKRAWLEWNTISSDSNKANQEILFRARMNNSTDTTGPAMIMRADTAAATNFETGYVIRMAGSGVAYYGINLAEYNSGTISAPSTKYAALSWSANTWVWVRARINSTSISLKIWEGAYSAEPGSYGYTTTDASISTGSAGLWLVGSHTVDWDYIAVGTNGDAAPAPPPMLSSATSSAIGQTTATVGCTSDSTTGTLYAVITTSATTPSAAQIAAGQDHTGSAAVWSGNDTTVTAGTNTFSATGLTASTSYYTYFVQYTGSVYSTILSGSFSTTAASGPTLSAATSSAVAEVSATVGASTDTASGTLYVVVTTSATTPSAAQIKAGQTDTGAAATYASSKTPTSGANTFSATGLSPSTAYYYYLIQNSASDSNIVNGTLTTGAVPALSSPTSSGVTANTATIGCTSDDSAGTLYVVVTTSATTPSSAQIKAGQNHAGAAATFAASDNTVTAGANTFAATGLASSTAYYFYFIQNDTEADSNILGSTFTTSSTSTGGRISWGGTDAEWDVTAAYWDEPDSTAPTVSLVRIARTGTSITVYFSEPVEAGAGGTGGWAVTASGGAVTMTYSSAPSTLEWTYTLSRTIATTETVTVAYTQPGNGIQDLTGNDLATFTGRSAVFSTSDAELVAAVAKPVVAKLVKAVAV